MFGAIKNFIKTQSIPNPEVELYDTFLKLCDGNRQTILALHLSLSQMWQLFQTKYSGITDFAYKDDAEKLDYLKSLLKMEKEFLDRKMYAESVSCKLLGLVLANTMGNGGGRRDMDKVVRVRAIFEHFRHTGQIDMTSMPDPDAPRIHIRR